MTRFHRHYYSIGQQLRLVRNRCKIKRNYLVELFRVALVFSRAAIDIALSFDMFRDKL